MKNYFDIIIAGSGLTGLCASISLAKLGYKIGLIDIISYEQRCSFNYDSRTTALSVRTANFLDQAGIWKKIFKYACPINKILIEEPNSQTNSYFNSNVDSEPLGYMIENKYLIKELIYLAKAEKYISKIKGKVTQIRRFDKFIETQISGHKKMTSSLLIGADGKYSNVRSLADIKYFKKSYNQKAFTFNIKHQKPHKNIAIENFLEEGPLACLPINKNKNKSFYSSVVWSSNARQNYYVLKNKKKYLDSFLKNNLSNRLGKIEIVSSIKHWDLSLVKSKEYIDDRVLLLGDSAHSIHPLAGQGFNLTIRGLEKLCSIGKKNIKEKKDIGNLKKLADYNYKHYLDAQAIIFATDKLNTLFSNSNPFLKVLRVNGLRIFNKSSFLNNLFKSYASSGKVSSTSLNS